MALDMQTAIANYGFVAVFAQSNPEIKAILEEAAANEWDSARFERRLWDTAWWKGTDETRRSLQILQSTDPASYNAQLAIKADQINTLAAGYGKTGYDPYALAKAALENGWNDNQLRQVISDTTAFRSVDGALTGQAGEIETHVRNTWASFGMSLSDEWAKNYAQEVLSGRQTLGGLDNEAARRAKQMFPNFADAFDQGKTLREIADPYITTLANTLELPPDQVNLQDPYIKKALQGQNGEPTSLWQFERSLKDDARWQYTKQANNEAYSLVQQIGKDWGFM